MKKNIKLAVILGISGVMAKTNLSKCETQEKFKIARSCGRIKAEVEKYEKLRKEVSESLRPDNWDELMELERNLENLPDDKKAIHQEAAGKYTREVSECLEAELDKEVEIEIETLDEGGMGRLLDSNPEWTVAQIDAVMEVFMEA